MRFPERICITIPAALAALVQERAGATVTLGEITPPEWAAAMVDQIEMPVRADSVPE